MPPIPLASHFATCYVYIVIVSEFKRRRGRSVAEKKTARRPSIVTRRRPEVCGDRGTEPLAAYDAAPLRRSSRLRPFNLP